MSSAAANMSGALQPRRAAGPRPRLGEILIAEGSLGPHELREALDVQSRQPIPLGDLLLARSAIGRDDLLRALARQAHIGHVDLHASPPDPALIAGADPADCLHRGRMPWRQDRDGVIFAVTPSGAAGPAPPGRMVLADQRQFEAVMAELAGPRLAERAVGLCPEPTSCRRSMRPLPRLLFLGAALLAALLAWTYPAAALTLALLLTGLASALTAGLRLAALAGRFSRMPAPSAGAAAARPRLPVISILVPLFRETEALPGLIRALRALDYPAACLDVRLLIEEGDDETLGALSVLMLPGWITPLTVPPGRLRTKPRAMNYALPFCRGSLLGIYDAEDRPERDQLLRVVRAFETASPRIACIQGQLDIRNAGAGWLARAFAAEYAQWFGLILPGLARLGLPIPLGGTTVFFRLAVLRALGGWDAHNVTEDADIGLRLARFGWRTQVIGTTTREEAVTTIRAWIGQRSRWIKGYLVTALVHLSRPDRAWTDLGSAGFLAVLALFPAALWTTLAWPLHLWFWAQLALPVPPGAAPVPGWALTVFAIANGAGALSFLAVLAVTHAGARHRHLAPALVWLPVYWPLATIAALRAIVELVVAPFHWTKTRHGP